MRLKVKLKEDNMRLKVNFGEIYNVSDGGYERGYAEGEKVGYSNGYTEGKAEGIEQGIEQGKQAEYDFFWDSIQNYGTRSDYDYAFRRTKWDKPFEPKYSFGNVTTAKYLFEYAKVGDNLYTDKLDFSQCSNMVAAFFSTDVTRLKKIDMRYFKSGSNGAASTFWGCKSLKEISEFYPPINTGFATTFNSCEALETINFCSELAANGLNLSASKNLGRASIESIINAMSDTKSGLSVTLSQKAVNNAFTDEEWATLIATKPNWTISLV